jgi:hypothetical protein
MKLREMARTLKSIILELVNKNYGWVSRGELFLRAQDRCGYQGEQADLLRRANLMVADGRIRGRLRGKAQTFYYAANDYEEAC